MRVLLISLLFLTGCSVLQPKVDECASYETTVKKSYCYLSKEVTSLRLATAQSLKDGVITIDQAKDIAKALNDADSALDTAESFILTGDEFKASQNLGVVKSLLLELK